MYSNVHCLECPGLYSGSSRELAVIVETLHCYETPSTQCVGRSQGRASCEDGRGV